VPPGRFAGRTLTEVVMDIETLPDMLRVEEAAAVLRISRSRAYDEVAAFQRTGGREGLPSIRIGTRCLRVPKRALLDWIEEKLGGADGA
jgi:predicted DNA-binding transcriptional regulator AlpA